MNKWCFTGLLAIIILTFNGCGVYTFTGTNTNAQTITILNFYNDTGMGPATLSQQFTEELRDYYLRNTSLNIVEAGGELLVEGSIVGYNTMPVAPIASGNDQQTDVAGSTRLTIRIKVDFTNTLNEEEDFSRSFSFYDDFDSRSSNLTAEEDQLIDTIFDQIIFDIFNATVANW
ncbi:MAG: hypothetical protein DHS20C17_31270 [Cyclobacteriaceae bacterium]|nr:MAG: hypothetical protein DHS20C17_31270 [Cyclobacteriaceae bacterium]